MRTRPISPTSAAGSPPAAARPAPAPRNGHLTAVPTSAADAAGQTALHGAPKAEDPSGDSPPPERPTHSPNVRWQRSALTRTRRWQALGHHGATIWFTGLPAAGKSTIAGAVEEHLVELGRPAFLLDGDNLRHGLNGDLGFDEHARRENVRRTAHVARLLAESGTVALVSLVSPYASDRRDAAELHRACELPFIEVFVDAPLALCQERDPKGLYARARAGDLQGLTGVDAPYEAPTDPDLLLRSGVDSVDHAVHRVVETLALRLPQPA